MSFEIVKKNSGAMHVNGFEVKTRGPKEDRSNITGVVGYYAESACQGLSRIQDFVDNFRKSALVKDAKTVAELAQLWETLKTRGHKMCGTCEKNLKEAIAAEQAADEAAQKSDDTASAGRTTGYRIEIDDHDHRSTVVVTTPNGTAYWGQLIEAFEGNWVIENPDTAAVITGPFPDQEYTWKSWVYSITSDFDGIGGRIPVSRPTQI